MKKEAVSWQSCVEKDTSVEHPEAAALKRPRQQPLDN